MVVRGILWVLVCVSLAGCGLLDKQITLDDEGPAAYAVAPNGEVLYMAPFADERDPKNLFGYTYNSFGMAIDQVLSDSDAGAWLAQTLQKKLAGEGYDVRPVSEDQAISASRFVVSGAIQKTYTTRMMTLFYGNMVSAEVRGRVTLRYAGQTFTNFFTGEVAKKGYGHVSGDDYKSNLQAACDELAERAVEWIRMTKRGEQQRASLSPRS